MIKLKDILNENKPITEAKKKVNLASLSVGNTYKDSRGYPVTIVDIGGSGNSWKVTYKDGHGKKKTVRTSLKKGINLYEFVLKEDDYATQYVDMIDDITKEVTRKSSKIIKLLNKQDKITGTKNARVYNQAVDKHFRNFIADVMKITSKIED